MRSTVYWMGLDPAVELLVLFFSVLGGAVTVYSGLFSSFTMLGYTQQWSSVGEAVDDGVAYAFMVGWPFALSVCISQAVDGLA